MIKLVLCDMDLTLVPRPHQTVTPLGLAAIHDLLDQGVYVGAASGRGIPDLRVQFAGDEACVRTAVACAAGDDAAPVYARGLLAECPPDGDAAAFAKVAEVFEGGAAAKALASGSAAPRTLLAKLGLPHAEIRRTSPLSFACRCSAERAAAVLASIPPAERASLPPSLDVTCHMCGRTWTVKTGAGA